MDNRNIVLVGFMGAGKTAVGQALARKLRRTFLDMDAELEARALKPISRIFAEEGEAAFRRMERDLVVECSCRQNLVIAAGGGVVLNPDNVRDFTVTGYVICLKATPEEILRRVELSKERPLLEQGDKAERIRALLLSRQKLYDALAYQVDTTGKSVAEVVPEVLNRIFCRGIVNPAGS
ncbi:MAG: shikimate kinase [Lentisphaerae bacterium]|nr:shikimate kinase [Lentisphaerota bacterium]